MKDILYKNEKIEVRKSPLHGYGVFAKEKINKGEVLEECHYIVVTEGNTYEYRSTELEKNMFRFPKKDGEGKTFTIPLGYGCIFNSATSEDTRNANWECDEENNVYLFLSVKDISKDDEILTYYGDGYWDKMKNTYNITIK